MQHTSCDCSERSVAHEAEAAYLLLSEPEGTHVGSLAQGRDTAADRKLIRWPPLSDTAHPGRVGRDSPSRAAPFQIGLDAKRARRDLAWRGGGELDARHSGLDWPS